MYKLFIPFLNNLFIRHSVVKKNVTTQLVAEKTRATYAHHKRYRNTVGMFVFRSKESPRVGQDSRK